MLGLQLVSARLMEPWEKFLKATAELTLHQYNASASCAAATLGAAQR